MEKKIKISKVEIAEDEEYNDFVDAEEADKLEEEQKEKEEKKIKFTKKIGFNDKGLKSKKKALEPKKNRNWRKKDLLDSVLMVDNKVVKHKDLMGHLAKKEKENLAEMEKNLFPKKDEMRETGMQNPIFNIIKGQKWGNLDKKKETLSNFFFMGAKKQKKQEPTFLKRANPIVSVDQNLKLVANDLYKQQLNQKNEELYALNNQFGLGLQRKNAYVEGRRPRKQEYLNQNKAFEDIIKESVNLVSKAKGKNSGVKLPKDLADFVFEL